MDIEFLKSRFYVCSESKTGLRWSVEVRGGQYNQIIVAAKDSEAGSWSKVGGALGYWEVGTGGKSYWAHRVVWALSHGDIDSKLKVDHIDGNGLNNKIENLRLVSHKTNLQNQKMNKSNKTGVSGVCRTSCGYWKASWTENGKNLSRKFNVNRYGEADAKRMAIEWRVKVIEMLNANGERYTERHGI